MKQILSMPGIWILIAAILIGITAVIISLVSYRSTQKYKRNMKPRSITEKDIREWNEILKLKN